MQIDEDDSDHNLEAITERERKPSRVPLCPSTPRKPYEKFSRLHCFLVSPWSHGGADQLLACLRLSRLRVTFIPYLGEALPYWSLVDFLPAQLALHKGRFCTELFLPVLRLTDQ